MCIRDRGMHTLKISVDSGGSVDEAVEDDPFDWEFEVFDRSVLDREVDLIADDNVYWPGFLGGEFQYDPPAGEPVRFFYGWYEANDGPALQQDFVTVFEIRDMGVQCTKETNLARLGLMCDVTFPAPGTYRWRVRVDVDDVIEEPDNENNWMQGDITIAPAGG